MESDQGTLSFILNLIIIMCAAAGIMLNLTCQPQVYLGASIALAGIATICFTLQAIFEAANEQHES